MNNESSKTMVGRKVIYFGEELTQKHELVIIREHKDGTVDLARGSQEGVLLIGRCPILEEPKCGHCVLVAK